MWTYLCIHCSGVISWTNENTKEQNSTSDKLSYIEERCVKRLYVHGILQARILEWVAIPLCRGYS